jgi:hypothetical protein
VGRPGDGKEDGGDDVSAPRGSGESSSERTRRPLARRFTYRYAIAVAGFVAVGLVTIFSYSATLDRVDEANADVRAVSAQVDRVQEIAALADRLSEAALNPDEVSPEQEAELAKLGADFFNALAELRNLHLGLTEGTGNSGLVGPPGELRE